MKNFWMVAVLAALAVPVIAQTTSQTNSQAGDKAQVFSAADLHQQLAALGEKAKGQGSSGSTLGEYGSHALKLSVRTASGSAEVHGRFDDVMVVTGGAATLITGGTVIDPKTGKDEETKGTGIQDGKSQRVGVGDIIHIPAGTPHQLMIPKGTTFSAFVVKVRE